jgi:hypothetical protein
MTEKMDYSKLTNSEIDERMAELMGWKLSMNGYWKPYGEDKDELVYLNKNWHPSSDLNQVWECEEYLIELNKDYKVSYPIKLWDVIVPISKKCGDYIGIHATARQRCEAMLMAIEEE